MTMNSLWSFREDMTELLLPQAAAAVSTNWSLCWPPLVKQLNCSFQIKEVGQKQISPCIWKRATVSRQWVHSSVVAAPTLHRPAIVLKHTHRGEREVVDGWVGGGLSLEDWGLIYSAASPHSDRLYALGRGSVPVHLRPNKKHIGFFLML